MTRCLHFADISSLIMWFVISARRNRSFNFHRWFLVKHGFIQQRNSFDHLLALVSSQTHLIFFRETQKTFEIWFTLRTVSTTSLHSKTAAPVSDFPLFCCDFSAPRGRRQRRIETVFFGKCQIHICLSSFQMLECFLGYQFVGLPLSIRELLLNRSAQKMDGSNKAPASYVGNKLKQPCS